MKLKTTALFLFLLTINYKMYAMSRTEKILQDIHTFEELTGWTFDDAPESKVKELLAEGKDVNIKSGLDSTVLLWAITRGYSQIVPPLLEAGVDPNIECFSIRTTALGSAVRRDMAPLVEKLLDVGADRTEVKGGISVSDVACAIGSKEVYRLLTAKYKLF